MENFNKFLEYSQKDKYFFTWTIFLKNTRIKIGRINISGINKQSNRCNIGYVLLPEYWGQGLMSEAANLLISYLFTEIKINKICASCNSDNIRSSKLLEKSGFQLEGVLKKHTYYEKLDKYKDDSYYGLLNSDFRDDV